MRIIKSRKIRLRTPGEAHFEFTIIALLFSFVKIEADQLITRLTQLPVIQTADTAATNYLTVISTKKKRKEKKMK